jgi:hypothetical protein
MRDIMRISARPKADEIMEYYREAHAPKRSSRKAQVIALLVLFAAVVGLSIILALQIVG